MTSETQAPAVGSHCGVYRDGTERSSKAVQTVRVSGDLQQDLTLDDRGAVNDVDFKWGEHWAPLTFDGVASSTQRLPIRTT